MTTDRIDPRTPDEARTRDAVRELGSPPAEAAFRERLKRDFVTGRVGERLVLELPVAWHRRRSWRIALAAVGLAAVAVVGTLANRGPAWTVLRSSGDGVAIVDQTPVPLGHGEELERRLRPGARLVMPAGAEIEIASAAGMVVEVTSGTEFTLPASPGRWLGRRVAGAVRHGEIRLTTGPSFHGARLQLDTPEASVQVSGTTVAVICEPAGTCVCVYEGLVRVGAKRAGAISVPGGRRRFVFSDARAPELAEIRPVELQKLGALRESRRDWLEGAAP